MAAHLKCNKELEVSAVGLAQSTPIQIRQTDKTDELVTLPHVSSFVLRPSSCGSCLTFAFAPKALNQMCATKYASPKVVGLVNRKWREKERERREGGGTRFAHGSRHQSNSR